MDTDRNKMSILNLEDENGAERLVFKGLFSVNITMDISIKYLYP